MLLSQRVGRVMVKLGLDINQQRELIGAVEAAGLHGKLEDLPKVWQDKVKKAEQR